MTTKVNSLIDTIWINKGSITLKVVIATGKEGDSFVVVSPSLNVSGYGKTEKDAQQSFNANIATFCEDIFSLSKDERDNELLKLGFHKERLRNKNFSKIYVDENGSLKNFNDETLEQKI